MTKIILQDVIIAKDLGRAEQHLLLLPGLNKYYVRLPSPQEQSDFAKHLRKYLSIWLTDCAFEVTTTNRYTIHSHEASITARRLIRAGESIHYLRGTLVAMTSDEEAEMDLGRRDFSVVLSSRRKTKSLFLGPARFANHDCKANARLLTQGPNSMIVVANRDIDLGTEITVNYGEHYFGEDNCECLCATCEIQRRGGWTEEQDLESQYAKSPSTNEANREASVTPLEVFRTSPAVDEATPEASVAPSPALRDLQHYLADLGAQSRLRTRNLQKSLQADIASYCRQTHGNRTIGPRTYQWQKQDPPELVGIDQEVAVSGTNKCSSPKPSPIGQEPARKRIPGDYIRPRSLLQRAHWAICQTCDDWWPEARTLRPRKECPRCERHSKLYGFRWPKTDNEPNEDELRVLDHRSISRYLPLEEAKLERKRVRDILSDQRCQTPSSSFDSISSSQDTVQLGRRLRARHTLGGSFDFRNEH